MACCILCTSSRVLHSGAREGALWCFVKRCAVAAGSVCQSFTPTADEGRDHELVKSDPKAHFDPMIAKHETYAGL